MRGHIWQWDGLCSLKIPDDWNIDEEDGVITIAGENGVGALQLSFARREETRRPTVDEAIDLAKTFADSHGWMNINLQTLTICDAPAACFEYRETDADDDIYWCIWFVVDERRAAFITYTSAWSDHYVEKLEREHIVTSFRLLDDRASGIH